MNEDQADLRDYYENEARLQLRRRRGGRRAEVRDAFIALLAEEGRTSVLDGGAGPGFDGEAFLAAGHRFVGVDLARGNAHLAAEAGVEVIQGSITSLPIRSGSIDAGWSMSTLMHLTAEAMSEAVAELVRVLRPGAPLLVGIWGREVESSVIDDARLPGSRRRFELRSFERNRELLARSGTIEWSSRWEAAADDDDYQIFRVRTHAGRPPTHAGRPPTPGPAHAGGSEKGTRS